MNFKDETNNELHNTLTCKTREKGCDCLTSKVCDPPHICLWISWDCFGPETPCPRYSCQSQFQQHQASLLILDLSSSDPGRDSDRRGIPARMRLQFPSPRLSFSIVVLCVSGHKQVPHHQDHEHLQYEALSRGFNLYSHSAFSSKQIFQFSETHLLPYIFPHCFQSDCNKLSHLSPRCVCIEWKERGITHTEVSRLTLTQ